MNNTLWLNKYEILNKCRDKKILCWGSSAWVKKTVELLEIKPEYIIDSNKNIHGDKLGNVEIVSYDTINDLKNYFIIITTGSYPGLVNTLLEKGLIAGEHFTCSPVLNNLRIRDDLINIDTNLLFTIAASTSDGGGLYKYNTKSKQYTKLYEGKTRGLHTSDNFIVLADEEKGLILFDKNFNVKKKTKLLDNSLTHGVHISESLNKIFVANAGRDSVSVHDLTTLEEIEEIKLSDKYDYTNEEQHHINDLYVDESTNSLYISMFSFSGNWRKNNFDGGVLEYSLSSKKIIGSLIDNLWMPHTIKFFNNTFMIADSMRGNLYKTNNKVIGKFQGFIRGIDYKENKFYLGQSSHRYFDRLDGLALNVPLDCGIYIFDELSKASVFHPLPEFENIYTIKLLES